MARQYSHRQFFRHVPNALLGRYFQEKKNVLHEIAFDELKVYVVKRKWNKVGI